jgi:hypothetical protein
MSSDVMKLKIKSKYKLKNHPLNDLIDTQELNKNSGLIN